MSNIILGKSGKRFVSMPLEMLLRSRLLVQANSGGGKSYLLRLLAEQLFGKVQVIIIDLEGEFASLREKFWYLWVGKRSDGADVDADVRSAKLLAEKILELKVSAVCDLFESFRARPLDRRAWVADFLNALIDAPRSQWRDLIVIVDEAHQLCPQENPKAASMVERAIIGRCKDAMVSLATVGRKRGYCAVWATQRLAKLDKDATAELLNRLVGMTVEDVDVDRAVDLMSVSKENRAEFRESLKNLEPGNFYGFGRAIAKDRTLIKIASVQTTHPEPGAQKEAAEMPPIPDKIKHLLPRLEDLPKQADVEKKTMAELKAELRTARVELAASSKLLASRKVVETKAALIPRPPAPAAVAAPRTQVKIKRIDVPIIAKRPLNHLKKALKKALEIQGFVVTSIVKPFERATQELFAGVNKLLAVDPDAILKARTAQAVQVAGGNGGIARPISPVAQRAAMATSKRPIITAQKHVLSGRSLAFAEAKEVPEDGGPTRPMMRILGALSSFENINIAEVSRSQLAGWLGLKVSGSFKNNLGGLRTLGYLDYADERVKMTDAGRKIAPLPEDTIDSASLLAHCVDALTGPQGKILSYLHGIYPSWATREEIAEALDLEVSGSFKNNLGATHTAEMVVYGTGDNRYSAQCAGWLFVQGT